MCRATVIIPTHNHGRLLLSAVRSVLRQTVRDFEIFIIGDGITNETREAVKQALALDARIRFFDHPKSPRTGEPYRHLALQQAAGAAVCYLSDDDLWLPDHLDVFCRALEKFDAVHSLPCSIDLNGGTVVSLIDLAVPEWVQWTLEGRNQLGLSFVGHTLEFYRRLPHGWRTAPEGRWTDHYMWEQMLTVPGMGAACTGQHTVVCFQAALRKDWTLERREAELLAWERKIAENPGGVADEARRAVALGYYHYVTGYSCLDGIVRDLRSENERQLEQQRNLTAENTRLNQQLQTHERRMAGLPGFARNILRWYWKKRGL